MSKGCIVLIIGLPASGKSTFSSKLVNYIKRKNVNMKPLYIDFDKVIPLERQKLIVNQLDSSSWKENRRNFILSCQAYLNLLLFKSPNCLPTTTTGSVPMVNDKETQFLDKIIDEIPIGNIELSDENYFCLIVEDNFYYKSMREPFLRLSKQFKLGFTLITINTPIDCCLRRNQIRSNGLDEKIITRMADCFEKPKKDDFGLNAGKRIQLMEINCDDGDDVDDDIQLEDNYYGEMIKLIRKSCDTPMEVETEDDHNQQESREISRMVTSDNLVHRFDKLLRFTVNQMMINPPMVYCNNSINNLGKEVSLIRKKLLKKFSNNQLDPYFGETLIEDVTFTNNQRLIQMVIKLIESELER